MTTLLYTVAAAAVCVLLIVLMLWDIRDLRRRADRLQTLVEWRRQWRAENAVGHLAYRLTGKLSVAAENERVEAALRLEDAA